MTMASTSPTRILVVDDEPAARVLLCRILQEHSYECIEADGVDSAIEALARQEVALVITDLDMPGKSGLELVTNVNQSRPDVGIVMVTGRGSPEIGRFALRAGASGYLSKPVQADDVAVTVFNALRRRELEAAQRDRERELEDAVAARTEALWMANIDLAHAEKNLRLARDETVERLALAAEHHDDETAAHVRRVSCYTRILAEALLDDAQRAETIGVASVLHDLGKIAIPDAILRKPAKLTADEREVMQGHTEIGYRILEGSRSEVLRCAAVIAHSHHEWYDGTGYPQGLAGDAIPIEGRLVAIADVFDSLMTDRVYRKAFSLLETLNIMRSESGSHFDPELMDVFLDNLDRLLMVDATTETEETVDRTPVFGTAL